MGNELAQLQQRQDQDVAAALTWWKEASGKSKMTVWLQIQKPHSDPVQEILTRFAQVGATHIAILAEKERLGVE